MRRPTRVTAAIIRRSGQILLARRKEGSHLGGLWEFPGGKIEDGETPEQCLIREFHEEFELEAKVGEFVISSRFNYGGREIELLAYDAELAEGTPALNSHDEIAWVPLKRLLEQDLAPADVAIAQALVAKPGNVER